MANYTYSKTVAGPGDIVTYSGTTYQNMDFTLPIDELKAFTIKSVTISMSISYNDWINCYFENIKVGSYSKSVASNKIHSYTWSDINATGVSSVGFNLKYNQFYDDGYRWIATLSSITYTINYSADSTSDTIGPLTGETIAKSVPTEFSWTNTSPAGIISSQRLYWKKSTDANYNQIVLEPTSTSYTFNANTFENGSIDWYVSFTDTSNNTTNSPVETVNVGITPTVSIAYPNNVNIRNSNQQIFTWEMHESIATGQKSYELQYKKRTATTWVTVTGTTSNQYHEFAANTFDTAEYDWKLKVTNNDNISTNYVSASFVAIGSTNAPNITNITNSSIPTITWQITSQDTFELEIYSGTERIYVSGVQVGENVRSFTPNIMLEDGNYIVKMRAMNEYGYFTEWSDYSFVLNPAKPTAVECIAYANDTHGINVIKGTGTASTLYVIRRLFGNTEWENLGILNNVYADNTVLNNKKYEYAIRNYNNAGYTDSNIVSMIINYQGLLIYDDLEFVQLYKTEDEQFDISHAPNKSYSYSYTIGRKYPVRESSEWMSHTTSMKAFVTFEQYDLLNKFYESNDSLWFKDKDFSFKCSIDSISIQETLLGRGYTINISLSRTDENEVNLIE